MRHGKSDWNHPYKDDIDRIVSKVGIDKTKKILLDYGIKDSEKKSEYIMSGFTKLGSNKGVKKCFSNLKKSNIILATLTNGHTTTTKQLLKHNKIDSFVDKCFSVDDVKKWKPFPEPYLNVIKNYNFLPSETIMIACHSWDLAGAKKVGMKTAYIENYENKFSPYFGKPDFSARNIEEVVDKIVSRNNKF